MKYKNKQNTKKQWLNIGIRIGLEFLTRLVTEIYQFNDAHHAFLSFVLHFFFKLACLDEGVKINCRQQI